MVFPPASGQTAATEVLVAVLEEICALHGRPAEVINSDGADFLLQLPVDADHRYPNVEDLIAAVLDDAFALAERFEVIRRDFVFLLLTLADRHARGGPGATLWCHIEKRRAAALILCATQ